MTGRGLGNWKLRTVRAAVSGTFFLAACAGPGTTDRDGTDGEAGATATAALLARLEDRCTDIVAADLGEGTLCADSGFRPGTDEFSFANWGRSTAADDNITVQTMIDLFGHSAVCMPGAESSCVVRPRTAQKLDEWNSAIANGRCEGMAALSQRLHMRLDLPSEFQPGAASASELRRDAPGLSRIIAHWWATQFLREVADAARQSRTRSPLQLVDELIVGLENEAGHTVGMYAGGAGHSVTPFAVTKRGDSWVIHAYDNNHPGRRTEIVVSTQDEWSYAWGTGAGGTGTDWAGTTGTLELTPMSARKKQFECPFCGEPEAGSDTVVTVTSDDATRGLHVFLDAGSAGTIEVYGGSVVSTVEGSEVTFGKSMTLVPQAAPSVTVSLPATLLEVDIELRTPAEGQVTSTSSVLVRRAGQADLRVSGAGPTGLVGGTKASRPVLSLFAGGATVTAAPGEQVAVSVAGDTNLVRTVVEDGGTLVIDRPDTERIDGNTIEVTYKGAGGSPGSRTTVDLAPSAVKNTVLSAVDGSLAATATLGNPQKVSRAARYRTVPVPRGTDTPAPGRATTTTVPTIEVTLPD